MTDMQWWWCCVWVLCACSGGEGLVWDGAYSLESVTQTQDEARADGEVSYRIRATLHVHTVWEHNARGEAIIQLTLNTPQLYLRGKHKHADYVQYNSVWDKYTNNIFYAHINNSTIQAAYLDPNEPIDIVNYKISIVSLLQFQLSVGEYSESDVSGVCNVLYEAPAQNVRRKVKRWCAVDAEGVVREARRISRYTLNAHLDALEALHAEELVTVGAHGAGLKVRAWVRLERLPEAPPTVPTLHDDLSAALAALPAALRPLQLALIPPLKEPADEPLDDEAVVSLLVALDEALGAKREESDSDGTEEESEESAGGAEEAAALTLRVLEELREAPRVRLLKLLQRTDVPLSTLCRVLALVGTSDAHRAVTQYVQIHDARDVMRQHALHYLNALALAPVTHEWVVRDTLRVGEEARVGEDVSRAALLAAGAAASRMSHDAPLALDVRHALVRSLTRCSDDECRATRLLALGNMRREDTADVLLQHAAGGGGAALAALDALNAAPPHAHTFARLDRLTDVALDERAPLEVRAAALDLLTRHRADVPAPLARVVYALHARNTSDAHELRRVLWHRLEILSMRHAELRRLPSMLEPALRGWDARAHSGASAVLVRRLGWNVGRWEALLEAVQVTRAGLLRRASVTLRGESDAGQVQDALTVHVWTRGLDALSDTARNTDALPAEDAAGGISLTVAGVRLRDITLFDGQAELLGHVWSGTASTSTPVLRALVPLVLSRATVPVVSGGVLRARTGAALALALDAHAHASLWYRTARASLRLRVGASSHTLVSVHTAWSSLVGECETRASPTLHITSHLDFYTTPALCVRAHTAPVTWRRDVTVRSLAGERRARVRRMRRALTHTHGRTLALGQPNDHMCRTLLTADEY